MTGGAGGRPFTICALDVQEDSVIGADELPIELGHFLFQLWRS
jgi:hypothetical protein